MWFFSKKLERVSFDKDEISGYKKRGCYDQIASYIKTSSGSHGRVICLHGFRRTGKTTLMRQLSLEFGGNIYQVKENQNMDAVFATLEKERKGNAKIVYIDEITLAKDFITNSALLADKWCSNRMFVVIAGTDSLGLLLAKEGQLFHRTFDVNMSYLTFAEHSRVLNVKNFDEYIQYGGLMCKGKDDQQAIVSAETARTFLNSAIADNIVNSMKRYHSVPGYTEIKRTSKEDLRKSVAAMVEVFNGNIDEFLLNSERIKVSVDAPFKDLLDPKKKNRTTTGERQQLSKVNRNRLADEYRGKIYIGEKLEKPATDVFVEDLYNLLQRLGLTTIVDAYTFSKIGNTWNNPTHKTETHLVLPALKYWLYEKDVDTYKKSSDFSALGGELKKKVNDQFKKDIFGRIQDAVAIIQTAAILDSRYSVMKVKFEDESSGMGEYDMLVWEEQENRHWAFETKHSSELYDREASIGEGKGGGQDKHLLNPVLTKKIERHYGKRQKNIVLYNGMLAETKNKTLYINIGEFLINLDKTKDMAKTVGHFEKCLEKKPQPSKKAADAKKTRAKTNVAPKKEPKPKKRPRPARGDGKYTPPGQ